MRNELSLVSESASRFREEEDLGLSSGSWKQKPGFLHRLHLDFVREEATPVYFSSCLPLTLDGIRHVLRR